MKKFFTHTDRVVPVHHPRVLVETAVSQGADRDALLENVGISWDTLAIPEARISYVQFGQLASNALRLTNNPALGLDFGRNLHVSHMGVLGLALMSSETIGAALEVGLRYYRFLAPAWELRLEIDEHRALLTARDAIPNNPLRVFATEALVTAIAGQGSYLLGRKLPVVELRLNYSKPEHFARYADLDMPIVFDREVTQSEFDRAVLDEPIAGADPATARLAERYCADEANAWVDGLVTQVRRLLASRRGRYPDLEEVARVLQTSTRSLRRGLQGMGTSYQELLDEARRARAEAWVRSTELTAQQIAGQLGFSDVRSFRRAFKRWTGVTPNVFRDEAEKA